MRTRTQTRATVLRATTKPKVSALILGALDGFSTKRLFWNLADHKRFNSKHLCFAAPGPVHSYPKRQTTRRTSLEIHHGLAPHNNTELVMAAIDLSF